LRNSFFPDFLTGTAILLSGKFLPFNISKDFGSNIPVVGQIGFSDHE